jgi:hypothetical protein
VAVQWPSGTLHFYECALFLWITSVVRMEHIYLGAFVKLRQATICVIAALAAWNNSIPALWIFMKFDVSVCIENLSRRFKCHLNLTRIRILDMKSYIYIYMIKFLWILLRIKIFQIKFTKNQNTFIFQYFFSKTFPFMWQCRKIWYSRTGHWWQYNKAQTLCMLDNKGCRHI